MTLYIEIILDYSQLHFINILGYQSIKIQYSSMIFLVGNLIKTADVAIRGCTSCRG